MKPIYVLATLALILAAAGCAPRNGQNTYSASEAGVSRSVEFGTVLNVREVDITGENSEWGTLIGAGVGAGGASYIGSGSGNSWATAGGALAGAVAGHFAEQAMNDRKGYEYVVNLQSGETKTIVQEQNAGDKVFQPGDHVMLQYCDRGEKGRPCTEGKEYQRLLPVAKLPPYSKNQKEIVRPVKKKK